MQLEYPYSLNELSKEDNTRFKKGKFYKCVSEKSQAFTKNKIYLCVINNSNALCLINNYFRTLPIYTLSSKFEGV